MGLLDSVAMLARAQLSIGVALLSSLALVVACEPSKPAPSKVGNGETAPEAKTEGVSTPEATPPSGRFGVELGKRPCAMLSDAMVSAVAKIESNTARQNRAMGNMCSYRWGEGYEATIGFVQVFPSDEEAAAAFDQYRHPSAGPAPQPTAAKAEGGSDVEAANQAQIAQAVAQSTGVELVFEPVDDLGDEALFDTTVHRVDFGDRIVETPANKVHVRVANLKFQLTMRVDTDAAVNREATIDLARMVIDGLPTE